MKSKRVVCKLCNCEGVQGTVLCKDHLDGYKYAVGLLPDKAAMKLVRAVMQTKKEEANNVQRI